MQLRATESVNTVPRAPFLNIFGFEKKNSGAKAQQAEVLKEQLRALCKKTNNGVDAPAEQVKQIENVAEELNQLNPTKNPAKSRLLQGKWRLLYSNVPGPSSGKLGPFMADVYQQIDIDARRIYNILELGPDWALRGALEADSEILNNNTWRITFDFVYNKLAGNEIQRKTFENVEKRLWKMTYLDDNFRVLYGSQESKKDENQFIFVMERA